MQSRFEVRREYRLPVEIVTARSDLPMRFVARDISPRGAFLVTDATPSPGTTVVCAFRIPGLAREFCFFGEITRVNPGRRTADDGPLGFGVRFLDAKPVDRLSIRRALSRYPALTNGLKRGRRDDDMRWPNGYTRREGRIERERRVPKEDTDAAAD